MSVVLTGAEISRIRSFVVCSQPGGAHPFRAAADALLDIMPADVTDSDRWEFTRQKVEAANRPHPDGPEAEALLDCLPAVIRRVATLEEVVLAERTARLALQERFDHYRDDAEARLDAVLEKLRRVKQTTWGR